MATCHFISIALAVCSASAVADESIAAANNEVSLSFGSHNIAYHEQFSAGQYLDSATGSQPAIDFGVTRQINLTQAVGIYTSFSLTYARGSTDYTGTSITGSIPLSLHQTGSTFNVDVKLGAAIHPSLISSLQFTPFFAYGFHNWHQADNWVPANGYGGDYRLVRWQQSASVGLMTQYAATPALVLSQSISVGRTFAVHTHDNALGTFDQHPQTTETANVSFDYAYTKQLHLTGSYQISRYRYGQSNEIYGTYGITGYFVEPPSTLTEQTVMLGVAYVF